MLRHLLPDPASVPVEPDRLRELVAGREWFHTINLGHGVITPGIDDTPAKLNWLDFPESLNGKSVLDVGSYDGYFAFESERRGAARVVASDKHCWESVGIADGRGFDIAHWALGSRVEKRLISVEEISPASVGMFDVVLFLGVLYHAQDPMRYLRHMFSVCSETLILETHTDGNDHDEPMMVFYPKGALNGDPSNFWGPNVACVEAMLYEVGFGNVEVIWQKATRLVVHAHR